MRTEAGCLGCYDFPGEAWAGDGSVHKGAMGAGIICLQRPTCIIVVRVGREEEGVSSLRAELAAMARALQASPAEPLGYAPSTVDSYRTRSLLYSFAYAFDNRYHDIRICVSCERCARAASYPSRYLVESGFTVTQVDQVTLGWGCL